MKTYQKPAAEIMKNGEEDVIRTSGVLSSPNTYSSSLNQTEVFFVVE